MKTRAERDREFNAVRQTLREAGEYVLHAAKAQEDLFDASVSAVAEAMGIPEDASKPKILGMNTLDTNRFYTEAKAERDAASTYEEYIAALEKLQRLLELEAGVLEAEVRIINAKRLLNPIPADLTVPPPKEWTESELKKEYKTITGACQALGIEARSWKDVAKKANQKSS